VVQGAVQAVQLCLVYRVQGEVGAGVGLLAVQRQGLQEGQALSLSPTTEFAEL
jgi:hypothetical protein